MAGRYVDELVRMDGTWRVKYRTAVLDVSITLKIEEDANALHGMATGRRDGIDLGVAALGIAHIASQLLTEMPSQFHGTTNVGKRR